jgi:hypothetical protein
LHLDLVEEGAMMVAAVEAEQAGDSPQSAMEPVEEKKIDILRLIQVDKPEKEDIADLNLVFLEGR